MIFGPKILHLRGMESPPCYCEQACYLTEHGRQSWIKSQDMSIVLGPRLKLSNGIVCLDPELRPLVDKRSRSHAWRHWCKVNKIVLVVAAMLLLTATMPFVWHKMITTEEKEIEYDESDAKLGRILRSLNAANDIEERHEQDLHQVASNVVLKQFPWLVHNKTLPNYFLGGVIQPDLSQTTYETSDIVFVQQHRSGGTAIRRCLQEIASTHHRSYVPNWNSEKRAFWQGRFRSKAKEEFKNVKFHTGEYSMGLCDIYQDKPCSYFTVLRDPMDRMVSSYEYCKQEDTRSTDEHCRVVNANDVSLRDWILLQGSITFQQLVYNATWCEKQDWPQSNYSLEGSAVRVAPSSEWPCWFKQRVHLERLGSTEHSQLLDYILQHLDSWFSVVGLVEDWDNSIAILEKVYNLPFTQCSNTKRPEEIPNFKDNKSNHNKRRGFYDDNDPEYLLYDYFVKKVLDPDYQIYKKAQKIFNVQRQMVFNTVNS